MGDLHFDRSQLIEALHLIQDKFNCLSQRHLKSLSELFKLSQAEVFEVASFYHHFDIVKDAKTSIDNLRASLEHAVKRQLMADVPYGVLLSG